MNWLSPLFYMEANIWGKMGKKIIDVHGNEIFQKNSRDFLLQKE
jgi:hypothetical protein